MKKKIQVFRERALLVADFSHNCSSTNPGTPLAITLHEVEKDIESKKENQMDNAYLMTVFFLAVGMFGGIVALISRNERENSSKESGCMGDAATTRI